MKRNYASFFKMLLPLFLLFCGAESAMAITEVHVGTAGTLSTLLPTSEPALKITGAINGTDVKYLRELINGGKVTDLDDYTAIEPITPDACGNDANAPVYDLIGRKVIDVQPGMIYIRNGKKFIAK